MSVPFQLLEINIISAQDLAPISKSIKAYAVAWLHPERKLATKIDQLGHTNPTWNEKFVFRVDDNFLNSENSVIMIEIYASTWLRDVLIGTVGVLISNLLPRSCNHRPPKLRFVALQIRRPSGRPQGILNIGAALLDSTMRSMPLYSELSSSTVEYWDLIDNNNNKKKKQNHKENHEPSPMDSKLLTLQRCQSEINDSTINDYTYYGAEKHGNDGYNGYDSYNGYGQDSEVGLQLQQNAHEESLCSDVGPSPSVVAAAIAKGLYPIPSPPRTVESSAFDEWTENNSTEGMKTKLERWKTELTPAYEVYDDEITKVATLTPRRKGKTPRPPRRHGGGLFSCFGTGLGCEFSITCGGGNSKKRRGSGKARLTGVSELTYGESSFI